MQYKGCQKASSGRGSRALANFRSAVVNEQLANARLHAAARYMASSTIASLDQLVTFKKPVIKGSAAASGNCRTVTSASHRTSGACISITMTQMLQFKQTPPKQSLQCKYPKLPYSKPPYSRHGKL